AEKRMEWQSRYDAWKTSGSSVAEWCRAQGLKDYQMYYWVQKFEAKSHTLEDVGPHPRWTAVDVKHAPDQSNDSAAVFIYFDTISVEVRAGTDMALLSDVVHVLQNAW